MTSQSGWSCQNSLSHCTGEIYIGTVQKGMDECLCHFILKHTVYQFQAHLKVYLQCNHSIILCIACDSSNCKNGVHVEGPGRMCHPSNTYFATTYRLSLQLMQFQLAYFCTPLSTLQLCEYRVNLLHIAGPSVLIHTIHRHTEHRIVGTAHTPQLSASYT